MQFSIKRAKSLVWEWMIWQLPEKGRPWETRKGERPKDKGLGVRRSLGCPLPPTSFEDTERSDKTRGPKQALSWDGRIQDTSFYIHNPLIHSCSATQIILCLQQCSWSELFPLFLLVPGGSITERQMKLIQTNISYIYPMPSVQLNCFVDDM